MWLKFTRVEMPWHCRNLLKRVFPFPPHGQLSTCHIVFNPRKTNVNKIYWYMKISPCYVTFSCLLTNTIFVDWLLIWDISMVPNKGFWHKELGFTCTNGLQHATNGLIMNQCKKWSNKFKRHVTKAIRGEAFLKTVLFPSS